MIQDTRQHAFPPPAYGVSRSRAGHSSPRGPRGPARRRAVSQLQPDLPTRRDARQRLPEGWLGRVRVVGLRREQPVEAGARLRYAHGLLAGSSHQLQGSSRRSVLVGRGFTVYLAPYVCLIISYLQGTTSRGHCKCLDLQTRVHLVVLLLCCGDGCLVEVRLIEAYGLGAVL